MPDNRSSLEEGHLFRFHQQLLSCWPRTTGYIFFFPLSPTAASLPLSFFFSLSFALFLFAFFSLCCTTTQSDYFSFKYAFTMKRQHKLPVNESSCRRADISHLFLAAIASLSLSPSSPVPLVFSSLLLSGSLFLFLLLLFSRRSGSRRVNNAKRCM